MRPPQAISREGNCSNKVFCIGFHKTGTTSLAVALEALGYRVTGPNGVKDPDIRYNVYSLAARLTKRYDAFQDNPWPVIYKEMDEWHPGSKFILTLRPSHDWIDSQVRHFGRRATPMREWIYGIGYPMGNELIYVDVFERHNKEVLSYFEQRPGDLLVMDLAKGDGWEKLCPFLGREVPNIPFPHANLADNREKDKRWDRRITKGLKNRVHRVTRSVARWGT